MRRGLAAAITISWMLVLMAGLTGCTTYQNFKAAFGGESIGESSTITIGVFEPITGGDSKAAEAEIRGIQLAQDAYPNIGDKIVDLVYSDNSSDIDAVETGIRNLISYKPAMILGSYGSVYSLAASQYLEDAEIPAITMTNTNPLVTRTCPYYYRVCYADANQGDLLGRYVVEATKKQVAGVILPKGDDVALARVSTFTDRIEAETGNSDAIQVYEQYESGAQDFADQLEAVKDSDVRYVFLPGDAADVIEIMRQAGEMGLDVTFLGCNDWASEEFKKQAGDVIDESSVAYVTYIDPTLDADSQEVNKETEKFLAAYHEMYGDDAAPDENVALGYDAYLIAINAVAEAGDHPTGSQIKKVLDGEKTFEGVSGDIRFNDVGDPIKTAYISTMSRGEEILLYTLEPAL